MSFQESLLGLLHLLVSNDMKSKFGGNLGSFESGVENGSLISCNVKTVWAKFGRFWFVCFGRLWYYDVRGAFSRQKHCYLQKKVLKTLLLQYI